MKTAAGLAIALACALEAGAAAAQSSPEELILYVARARNLAREAIEEAAPSIGVLMLNIGPSSAAATDAHGFGHWSLSLGGRGAEFSITNPDYTEAHPAGADKVDGAIGAAYADLGLGLLYRDRGPRTTFLGSLDLLLRYGLTVGDQPDIADKVELGHLKRIYGAGFRIGILQGRDVPSLALTFGANHLTQRTFSVTGAFADGADPVPYRVDLVFEETSYFALLELARDLGRVAPFAAAGLARHHLTSSYDAIVVFDVAAADQSLIAADVDVWRTRTVAYGGVELGGRMGLVLEGGVTEDGAFGSVYLRFHR